MNIRHLLAGLSFALAASVAGAGVLKQATTTSTTTAASTSTATSTSSASTAAAADKDPAALCKNKIGDPRYITCLCSKGVQLPQCPPSGS